MSETAQSSQDRPTFWQLARHTPMRDAIRGRLTGRLDYDRAIERSGLPVAARDLIRRVVRKTRLWRIEKADVAVELIAHFADGIDAAQTPTELIAAFGDERRAARLIRRAKRRGRGLAWHAMVFARRIVLVLLVIYALLAIRFYIGKPSPSVDYIAEANKSIANVPQEQRAWPIYRRAMIAGGLQPRIQQPKGSPVNFEFDARPGERNWPACAAWLKQHADALEIARTAADKPSLGLPLASRGQENDPALTEPALPAGAVNPNDLDPDAAAVGPLNRVSQLHLVVLRTLGGALTADVYLAIEQNDPDRAIGDVSAVHSMAAQLREEQVVDALLSTSVSFRESAVDAAHALMASRADTLLPLQLQRLAHVFAGENDAHDVIGLTGARAYSTDLIQRVYTDDGNGEGRITPAGIKALSAGAPAPFVPDRVLKSLDFFNDRKRALRTYHAVAGPVMPTYFASRREATGELTRLFDLAEANLNKPIRDARWDAYLREAQRVGGSPGRAVVFAPAADSFHVAAEQYLGRRDGLIVGVAIESYRRSHDGRMPGSLAELAPGLLPNVPLDRMTGQPLHYRIKDGKPIVYSVGDDNDDDGGVMPLDSSGNPADWVVAQWPHRGEPARDGDWVLYPRPLVKRPDVPIDE